MQCSSNKWNTMINDGCGDYVIGRHIFDLIQKKLEHVKCAEQRAHSATKLWLNRNHQINECNCLLRTMKLSIWKMNVKLFFFFRLLYSFYIIYFILKKVTRIEIVPLRSVGGIEVIIKSYASWQSFIWYLILYNTF